MKLVIPFIYLNVGTIIQFLCY